MREWIVRKSVLLCSILVAIAFLATMGRTAIQSIAGLAIAGSGNQWVNWQDISVGTPITTGAAEVGLFGYNGVTWDALRSTTANGLVTDVSRIQGTVTIAGAKTPSDAFANPTDALDTLGFNMGWNGSTWDRLASGANNADAEAVRTLGVLEVDAYLKGFNGTTYDRVRSSANNADAQAVVTLGDLQVNSYLMGFNGTTWDRLRSTANNADAVAVTTLGIQTGVSYRYGFNGTTWDRLRSGGNAADAEATVSLGLTETDSYLRGFNGTTFDRLKSEGNNADGVATSTLGSLMQKAYAMIFNGTTWDRQRSGIITGQALVDWSSTSSSNITTNVTTAVKGTGGILNTIVLNAAGTTSTVALYNIASAGCTGTPASGYVITIPTGTLGTSISGNFVAINHTFTLGICVLTAGAAAADISVLYR